MLQVPAKFVEGAIHSYRQTCKRARNCLDGLVAKTYTVEKKKRWFGKDVYEVNIFGEHTLNHDTTENMLEIFLRDDKISPMDYQLLKFYDSSLEKFSKSSSVNSIISSCSSINVSPPEKASRFLATSIACSGVAPASRAAKAKSDPLPTA